MASEDRDFCRRDAYRTDRPDLRDFEFRGIALLETEITNERPVNEMSQTEAPLKSLPRDTALREHCRRVAGLSQLVAHHLRLRAEENELLHAASMLHHSDEGLLSGRATVHLLHDLFYDAPHIVGEVEPIPETTRALLSAWRRPGSGSEAEQKLADILRRKA